MDELITLSVLGGDQTLSVRKSAIVGIVGRDVGSNVYIDGIGEPIPVAEDVDTIVSLVKGEKEEVNGI